MCCFTDGSVKNCKSGIGVYIGATDCKLSLQLDKYATVIQTEIVAVMTAAQTLHHSGFEGKIIKIFTDSKACIHAISSNRTTSKTVVVCQKALNLIGSRNIVSLVWVPSHMGIKGNECSDFLARKASNCTLVGPEPGVHVSKNTVRLLGLSRTQVVLGGTSSR